MPCSSPLLNPVFLVILTPTSSVLASLIRHGGTIDAVKTLARGKLVIPPHVEPIRETQADAGSSICHPLGLGNTASGSLSRHGAATCTLVHGKGLDGPKPVSGHVWRHARQQRTRSLLRACSSTGVDPQRVLVCNYSTFWRRCYWGKREGISRIQSTILEGPNLLLFQRVVDFKCAL
ncbi:hypothetical protein K505DRAFT_328007 [Melanomma pulvis-pyrius CBS 109.77]|uniref:Secreted protein n=1 Tax=Melanomma pulvis-pyrius CBS 109.77 TaxID=1314802 RepID=A0A6A6X0V2_9PLEO|nr:hypothetical protein K505DRAFT_328007 [Melanomma pulvis-pyrius CBS 109.77]